ncbi:phosphatidylinositol-specific phospholipase C domain-containing protein [Zooshikella ganghwensis]|uniref:Phosphatidylinositol diacylglycerol-lyase n=1 Tax=Zooshikella ganghwensis TaxID=202772 RepID=A0A4P9VNI0_9GAMM|nr:hypothetical protein B9G39_09595 [Zooshikella ganghwensis]
MSKSYPIYFHCKNFLTHSALFLSSIFSFFYINCSIASSQQSTKDILPIVTHTTSHLTTHLTINKTVDPFDQFNHTNVGKVLRLQQQLNLYIPLSKANFWGTHNSYNTKAWRYPAPNQKHHINEQLRMGAQFIELDVHYMRFFAWEKYDTYVCHGTGPDLHLGCVLGALRLENALFQIKQFLENPVYKNQTLILYLEDNAYKGGHSGIFHELKNILGEYIYPSGGCTSIPDTLTPKQILDAGKRIIIWKDNDCAKDSDLKSIVFSSLGNIHRKYEQRAGCINCTNFTAPQIAQMIEGSNTGQSPANIIALDLIHPGAEDIPALLWSWHYPSGEPRNTSPELDCAVQTSNPNPYYRGGSWKAMNCDKYYYAACQNINSGIWAISYEKTPFSSAERLCQHTFGKAYHFSTPSNAQENLKLTEMRQHNENIWINISDSAQDGNWIVPHEGEY